jgi:hypothetical protein
MLLSVSRWSRSQRLRVSIAALGLFVLAAINSMQPMLRLADARANALACIVILSLPWVAVVLGGTALAGRRRMVWVSVLAPILVAILGVSVLGALNLIETISTDRNSSFSLVRELTLQPSRVRAYIAECGVPCGNTLVVVQERPLLFGVVLVRTLGSWDEATDVVFSLDTASLRLDTKPMYTFRHAVEPDIVTMLRPWVYF